MSASITTLVTKPPPEPANDLAPNPPAPSGPVVRVRPPDMTVDRAVAKYISIRDQIAALKKEQAKALLPYEAALETLAGWLLNDLNTAKVVSMRALTGTAYKSVRTSATVEDWPAVLAYIKENEAWDLLEARVSKLAVAAVVEDTKAPVPGVKTSREIIVNVRKS